MPSTRLTLLIIAVAVIGAVAPAMALPAALGAADQTTPTETPADANESATVNVTPGAQLSTVLTATVVTTRGEIEDVRFELELERGDDGERAEALADRAEELAERAAAIREDYAEVTAAREAGELSPEAYARELATLNARAEDLLGDVEALRAHARNVSGLELEAAGFNRSALRAAAEDLDPLTGLGPSAILQRFLGESTGGVELTTESGLRVEVEGEDGEHSLEVKRPRDDNGSITVPQNVALETARSTLPPGNWTLTKASVHPDSGYYKFEFDLEAANRTGEAEVRIDGSTGEVFRLEIETERPDDDDREVPEDDDEDDEREDRELALLLVGGQPAPNGTITVRALADGEPAANVTVSVNGAAVAETDADGGATFTLPRAAEVTVRAGEAELEFEFDEAVHERDEVYRQLDAAASLHDGVVTVAVTFDGEPVTGATLFADDRLIGETGPNGTVSFAVDVNATDELEVEVVKGEFEAEFEYDLDPAGLTLTEAAHEGDGDKLDDEADGDAEDETEEDDGDDDDSEAEDTPEEDGDDDDSEAEDTPEEDDGDDDSSGSGSGDDEETEDGSDDDSSGSG